MRLTADESKALGFIALLLALSAAARVIDRPEPIRTDLAAIDPGELAAASRNAPGDGGPRPLRPGETIDPNTAGQRELMRLPRAGAALAQRIIADRTANGRYRTLEDLDRVPGIGPATLEAWAGIVSLPRGRGSGARGATRAGPSGTGQERGSTRARASRASDPGTGGGRGGPGAGSAADPIDVNRATAADLERVPGIGPAIAARIIEHRNEIGRFTSIEQLVDVRGIGAATLERLRPWLRVGG